MNIDAKKSEWLAFRPGTDGAWDRQSAAHLARRAAFGTEPSFVDKLFDLGPEKAVDSLLEPGERDESLELLDEVTLRLDDFEAVQGWWFYRMLRSRSPALEKLALFWHGHFATSNRKVGRPRWMMRQVQLFQQLGTGDFGKLLLEMSKDAAMIRWLDGNSNRRGTPNENYARELMELFSLGIGNYSETDVKQAARAFTGWHQKDGSFWFNQRAHDGGEKEVFGKKGPFGGEELVDLCVHHPACPRFIAGKLFKYYVHNKPSAATLDQLGELYIESNRETGAFLRRLWSSRFFYRADVRRAIVSSPVDYTVGALRTMAAQVNSAELARATALMGQDVLRPPSVKGWDGGEAWINSTTLLARYRFAADMISETALNSRVDWKELESGSPDTCLQRFFPDGLPQRVRGDLIDAADDDLKLLVAGCVQLPEYQYI